MKVYEVALNGVSEAAAVHACMAYVQGGVDRKTHAFRPSPAEVAEFAKRRQASLDGTQRTVRNVENTLKALPEPKRPNEDARRAHVEAILGRKVEHKKPVNPPAMLAADRKRPMPWHDPAVLRESMANIEAHLEADGVPLHPAEAKFIDRHNPEDRKAKISEGEAA